MKGINYDNREYFSRNCKTVRYGKYKPKETVDHFATETIPITSIEETTFYRIYLELNNVIRWRKFNEQDIDMKISDVPIELMAHLMAKPMSYVLLFRAKDSKLSDIAKELGKPATSIYTSITKLRKAGYLVINEDSFLVPNDEMNALRAKVKESIAKNEHMTYDYIFKFCVK